MEPFPELLKSWRKQRRFSQLALALEANVSARHLAYLETGRARPSAAMVNRLGEALGLPLSARNQLLARAGFAARYERRAWDDHRVHRRGVDVLATSIAFAAVLLVFHRRSPCSPRPC